MLESIQSATPRVRDDLAKIKKFPGQNRAFSPCNTGAYAHPCSRPLFSDVHYLKSALRLPGPCPVNGHGRAGIPGTRPVLFKKLRSGVFAAKKNQPHLRLAPSSLQDNLSGKNEKSPASMPVVLQEVHRHCRTSCLSCRSNCHNIDHEACQQPENTKIDYEQCKVLQCLC